MTYPVRWNKYKIFRDFLQNFYDSVGYQKWNERFKFKYTNESLCIWVDGIAFSYEWLLHIGASTKTSNSFQNAGYFGEGFKIASLCAMRDYGWQVTMSSGNWELSVISVEQQIDRNKVDMLLYEVCERTEQNRSCLTLYPISEADFLIFKTVQFSFYYYENPMMGEKIWEGEEGAVYTRGGKSYDINLPYTIDFGRKGTVFCAYQLLGSNPFDLAVCLHRYKKDDRERKSLYTFEVVDVFRSISSYIDSYGAVRMLEKMRRYWNSQPKKHIDIHSWSPVIRNLIDKVAQSSEATDQFRLKYPDLLCLKPIYTIGDKNRRGQARVWLSSQNKKYLLVQSEFAKLGYTTLEEKCEQYGGFVINDITKDEENKGFAVLEEIVKQIYYGFFDFEQKMPVRRVIYNNNASYHGMAKVYKRNKPIVNNKGIAIRYEIGEIYLKRVIFRKDGYYDALTTYIHELCHVFGGDSSNAFSQGLTLAMELLLINYDVIENYRKKWGSIYGDKEKQGNC